MWQKHQMYHKLAWLLWAGARHAESFCIPQTSGLCISWYWDKVVLFPQSPLSPFLTEVTYAIKKLIKDLKNSEI